MTSQNQPKPANRGMLTMLVAGVAVVVIVVIGALLLLGGDEDDSGSGDETPANETLPPQAGPFSFSGTLNYDMPTPSPPVPNPQFSLDRDTEVVVTFTIDPVWEDCGFWWRFDATTGDFFYFGDHHLNEDTVEDTVELQPGAYQLQVGVSFESIDEHSCTGTAEYEVEIVPQ